MTVPVTIDVLEGGRAPERREDSLGWDCFAREGMTIDPLRRAVVPLGFRAAWEPRHGLGEGRGQWGAFLFDRSRLGNWGIFRLAGVIEGTYRDEWRAILQNAGFEPFQVGAGDRVIQFVLLLCGDVELARAGEAGLPESTRGRGGFGSTERIGEVAQLLLDYPPGERTQERALEVAGGDEDVAKAAWRMVSPPRD